MNATLTHPDGGKFRTATSRRFIVVRPRQNGGCITLYRTNDVQRAIAFAAKKGGHVFDTVAKKVRLHVTSGYYRWVEA